MEHPSEPAPGAVATASVGLLILALAAYFAIAALTPPEPAPETSPLDGFSAQRALRHVQQLAASPRLVGTPANRRAQVYLLERLTELGLKSEKQEATVLERSSSGLVVGTLVSNVLARRPGMRPGRALALVAHYDTRPTTPGAGDDASGVAVVLETLRALNHGPPIDNDVIVLFTDGEELGLMGARAFVDGHPWAEEVALVLNLEARGNRGVAPVFEAGDGNRRLIDEFARVAPYPLATSLSQDVYRRMPNDTDFTVFKKAGLGGLNFAFIGGHTAYHTRLDTPDRLDQASLQHLGSNVLALVRSFGRMDLVKEGGEDAVYFNPWRWWLVTYPQRWVVPLAVAGCLLVLVTLSFGVARQQIALSEARVGFKLFVLVLVLTPLLVAVAWRLFGFLFPAILRTPYRVPYEDELCGIAFLLLGFGIAALVGARSGKAGALGLAAGILAGWAVLALVSAVLLPGGSYLFVWPAASGALALALALATVKKGGGVPAAALWTLGAVPGIVLVAPLVPLMFQALTLRGSAVVLALVAPHIGMTLPLLAILGGRATRWLSSVALAVAILLLGVVVWRAGFDEERPRADSLFYALDVDDNTAVWVSQDSRPDPWTTELLGSEVARKQPPEFLQMESSDVLLSDAPSVELPPPTLEIVSDDRRQGRRVEVRVISPRGAPFLRLRAESTVPILAFELNGRRIETGDGAEPLRVLIAGVPAEGVRMVFELSDRWPVELDLIDQSFGLPQIPGHAIEPRPGWIIPSPSWLNHSTLVHKSYLF